MNQESIAEKIHTKWAGQNLIYKEKTGSTNDDARELGVLGAPSGTLVVADLQTKGRGSRGRSWETPQTDNIAMSLLIRPDAPPERISMLTLRVEFYSNGEMGKNQIHTKSSAWREW